jgi:hypothetical protein
VEADQVGGQTVGQVQGEALECPLLGHGSVVGLTEASGVMGAELGPFLVGLLGECSRC